MLPMDCLPPLFSDLSFACHLLNNGGVLSFPTETVYGLGALLSQEDACWRIYTIKKRDLEKPLMLHISLNQSLEEFVGSIPSKAEALIKHFWPGPLSLVLPKSTGWRHSLFEGRGSVGIRCPGLPLAQELLKKLKEPLLATSANLSGKEAKVSPFEVARELGDRLDGVLLYEGTLLGETSTVIDLCDEAMPKVVRLGAVSLKQIEAVIGPLIKKSATKR